MHLCYIDDSGDSKHGVTLTAIIIHEDHWSNVLSAWLVGRRDIHSKFGVGKKNELHANHLYKGRKEYCDTPAQQAKFGQSPRDATGRMMLAALAKHPDFTVVTIGTSERSKSKAYARFVAWLEDWAARKSTRLMLFYDGQQGLDYPDSDPDEARQTELWDTAIRAAKPYREVHRGLDIDTRLIVEDVIMQDSRYSQLIQAADLIAYGAYHLHRQEHPEIWGTEHKPVSAAIIAYMKLANHWVDDSDNGVIWLD